MSYEYGKNGRVTKGSFAARAQAAAARNMNAGTIILNLGRVAGWKASESSGVSKGSGGRIRKPQSK